MVSIKTRLNLIGAAFLTAGTAAVSHGIAFASTLPLPYTAGYVAGGFVLYYVALDPTINVAVKDRLHKAKDAIVNKEEEAKDAAANDVVKANDAVIAKLEEANAAIAPPPESVASQPPIVSSPPRGKSLG